MIPFSVPAMLSKLLHCLHCLGPNSCPGRSPLKGKGLPVILVLITSGSHSQLSPAQFVRLAMPDPSKKERQMYFLKQIREQKRARPEGAGVL